MKQLTKILIIILFVLCVPILAKAKEYVEYTNFLCDGNACGDIGTTGDGSIFNMNNATNYQFTIIGNDLNESETYTLTITSDYKNEIKTISGSELKNGYTYSNNDGNSKMLLELKDSKENYVYIINSFNPEFVYKAFLRFNDNFDDSKFDNIYNSIPKTKDGKIIINSIETENESPISLTVGKYAQEPFYAYGYINDNKGFIEIGEYDGFNKIYEVEFSFAKTNPAIKKKVDKYVNDLYIDQESFSDKDLILMEDLETVNYRYNEAIYGSTIEMGNSMVNYSSEFQKKIENSNLIARLDTRAGWSGHFYGGAFGLLNLEYNGIVYGTVETFGFRLVNVIYVPDETIDNTNEYIKAALKRIKEYLPKDAKVELTYKDKFSNLGEGELEFEIDDLIDVNKTLGEYYNLKLNGKDLDFFIVKDSSKIKNVELSMVDLGTNIIIKTENGEVPLDTKLLAEIVGEDEEAYKEIMKVLKCKNGITVNLKLFSNSIKKYINKVTTGNFKVYVPISDDLKGKNVSAYYVNEDGTIEEHKISVEGNYFVFDTTHFSIYTLAEKIVVSDKTKEEVKNPQTSDELTKFIKLLIISSSIIVGVLAQRKKINNGNY